MDLLGLLRAGDVAAFNDAREGGGRLELFAEELAELNLMGVDFSGGTLDKTDFTETNLTEANLIRASLCDIDGTSAVFDGVLGMRIRLRDAWLEEADLTGADFSHGDLTGAVLHRTKGEGIRLISAKLNNIEAHGAQWPLADLSEAMLKGADLQGADLSRARLAEARAGGCTLSGANLDGVDAPGFKMGGAKADGASFVQARLSGAYLVDADLTGADFRNADLARANLTGATLAGADLRGASLVDACLDGVDLSTTRLDDADLTGLDPVALGLGTDALDVLASFGARFDPDAPLLYDEATVASEGRRAAVVWMNPDSVEAPTLRWAFTDGSRTVDGVLPVSGAAVLFHTVVGVPGGYRIMALHDRADGSVLQCWPLSDAGVLGKPVITVLGFEPAVLPVVRVEDGAIWMWSMARRGPTIIIHRDQLDGAGLQVVSSDTKPQARGFLGRTHPVMLCKGGVVMSVGRQGVGSPRRTPEAFPARASAAAPVDDGIMAVWNTSPMGRDLGGLRCQLMGARGDREPQVLTEIADVNAVDAMPDEGSVLFVWTEDDGPESGRVCMARLPGGTPTAIPVAPDAYDQVRLYRDSADGTVRLALSTLTGNLDVVDLKGQLVARFTG